MALTFTPAVSPQTQRSPWNSRFTPTRSVVRSMHGMVASSQPMASEIGLEILKRGGNAVDAAIAMAAMLNVTEPMMTGVGGDAFMLVHWSKTGELKALNASGRAPKALSIHYFKSKGITKMPETGMGSITVPGAFDGWCTLRDKYGTMSLSDLLQPAIDTAENGYPVMEKAAEEWSFGVDELKKDPAAGENYLIDGRSPKPGEIFRQKNLARTLRILAKGGRDAYYKGEVGQEIVDYCQEHGGFLTMEDLAAQHSEWVDPISTDYRGYKVFECPPNGQGLTALIALNILEGFDLASLADRPDEYYHLMIEAIRLAFADRNRYIADPHFSKVPVKELLSKEYAAKRRALVDPDKAMSPPEPGDIQNGGDTTYFTVIDKDRNAVSFINSLYSLFGSGICGGRTGVMLQNRGAGFTLDPDHPDRLEPGKRPFHTIIPAMVFKDGKLFMSFGVMGGDMQPQGHVQVMCNLIDMHMGLQEAIDAPRFRCLSGQHLYLEDSLTKPVIEALIKRGHDRVYPPNGVPLRALIGGGQAIMVDLETGSLAGGSDPRKDGFALGY
ncbi:MAG TPA: gamma-glutamyltransferase [Blastocatellia bacterium]|nr:gamma-glutamyltransferase [Blastocatellia bacterium]